MRQRWEYPLFLHWPVDQERLRAQIPRGLKLDAHDGWAWLGIIAMSMKGTRPMFMPRVPVLTDNLSLNVRTYVTHDGVPGVYFFSLDADNLGTVLGARSAFGLPYHWARMALSRPNGRVRFTSARRSDGEEAKLDVEYSRLGSPTPTGVDSIEYFLTERYALYDVTRSGIRRTRISHTPWVLEKVQLHSFSSSMLQAMHLPGGEYAPMAFAGDPKEVKVMMPERVSASLPSLSVVPAG